MWGEKLYVECASLKALSRNTSGDIAETIYVDDISITSNASGQQQQTQTPAQIADSLANVTTSPVKDGKINGVNVRYANVSGRRPTPISDISGKGYDDLLFFDREIEKNGDKLIVDTIKTEFDEQGKLVEVVGTQIRRNNIDLVITALGSDRAEEPVENPKIIYAGDFITGGSTAVQAVAGGKKAIESIVANES